MIKKAAKNAVGIAIGTAIGGCILPRILFRDLYNDTWPPIWQQGIFFLVTGFVVSFFVLILIALIKQKLSRNSKS